MANTPKVGVGVIIENTEGKILIGKRIGSLAPYYSIPGGNVDIGETFEQAAIRELKEETELDLQNVKVIALTNNLKTYQAEGLHYISVILYTNRFTGTPRILEPEKCTELLWCDPKKLPHPHFEASKKAVECFLQKEFFISTE